MILVVCVSHHIGSQLDLEEVDSILSDLEI